MNIVKSSTILFALLIIAFSCQFARGESDFNNPYFGNLSNLFLKEDQVTTTEQSAPTQNEPVLEWASEAHFGMLKVYYIAIPEFDNISYELIKLSFKSDKVPFLAFGTTLYERIGSVSAKNTPDIYSWFPLSVYIDLYDSDFNEFAFYAFTKFSSWGKYLNPDSVKTSYLNYGLGFGCILYTIETGVLHIDNNYLKDNFYYINVGLDIGVITTLFFALR